jgi:hypothetical protein
MTTLKTRAQIVKQIDSIKKRNETLRGKIQESLIQIGAHVLAHGDASLADKLLAAVTGQDKVAILRWLGDHGFTRYSEKDAACRPIKSAIADCDMTPEQYVAQTFPLWYASAIETKQAARILDPVARLEALARQISKATNSHERVAEVDQDRMQAAFAAIENAARINATVN